jgi:hypothetical protein
MLQATDPLRRHHSPGGFLSIELNAVGWAALLGAGLAIGAVAAVLTPLPLGVSLVAGPLLIWGLVLMWDHRRFADSMVGLGYENLDTATGAAVIARAKEMGITATYEENVFDDGEVQRSIRCRQRDVEAVRELMGLRVP